MGLPMRPLMLHPTVEHRLTTATRVIINTLRTTHYTLGFSDAFATCTFKTEVGLEVVSPGEDGLPGMHISGD